MVPHPYLQIKNLCWRNLRNVNQRKWTIRALENNIAPDD